MLVPVDFKENIIVDLGNLNLENTWKLRGNVNVLKNYILKHPEPGNTTLLKNIDTLLAVSNDLYKFLTNIKGNVTAADYNKLARLFNTGGDTALAIEEIMSREDIKIPELVLSGLAMILTYVGNTSYISSALENCESTVGANSIVVYDHLWAVIHNYRDTPTPADLRKINEAMNTFFNLMPNREVSLTERILVITRLYQLLCMIYTAGILQNIEWVNEKTQTANLAK